MAKVDVRALYNTSRMLIKQAEEQAAKGEKISSEITNSLKEIYTQLLEFLKIYLIQCQDRFWGNILMEMELDIDFKQQGPVDLKIKRDPVALTINPMHCGDYTFPQLTGAIIQELEKLVFLHPEAYANLNSEKDPAKHENLEKASSAASASIVQNDIRLATENGSSNSNGCRLPDDAYTPTNLNNDCGVRSQEKQDISYYYNILNKFNKNNKGQQGKPSGAGAGSGSGNPNEVSTKNNNDGQMTHDWEGADPDETKDKIINMVSEAYNNLSDRQRGYIPGGVLAQIKKLLEPPQINWKQVLRKMVGSIPVPYRKTKVRLNRRQPFRGDLSGQLPKRTVNIVCCFDTSGSMSDEDLKYCMNEVFNIVKIYEGYKITIVECDAEVQRVYEAKNMSQLQTKMAGRGK